VAYCRPHVGESREPKPPITDVVSTQALKHEIVLAAALLSAGLLLLPLAIYWVGQFVVGAYEGDGVEGLIGGIWSQLGEGSITAWILVLSPYVVIQVLRLGHNLLRS
jgi:hypothetical protein